MGFFADDCGEWSRIQIMMVGRQRESSAVTGSGSMTAMPSKQRRRRPSEEEPMGRLLELCLKLRSPGLPRFDRTDDRVHPLTAA